MGKCRTAQSRGGPWLPMLLCLAWTAAGADDEPGVVAAREYDQVMSMTPNLDNGREVFLICGVCHRPEGWGSQDGTYPQIAGQHRTVIVKQLADIRARNRDNPLMYPFSVPSVLGGAQNLADVAAYVAQLPMTPDNGKGAGSDLELGERLFQAHCRQCHGDRGQGNPEEHLPRIAGQHYAYLVRQFDAIKTGRRKNADPKMTKELAAFTQREKMAVLDYTSRLPLSPEKVAPPGWTNPDFPGYVRLPPVRDLGPGQ